MTPAKLNLTIFQGATFAKVLTWQVGSPPTAVNLTGYTARMMVRATVDATAVLLTLTTENGGITLGGSAGTITLAITATATAALSFDTAVYDIELISGATVTRIVNGNIKLSLEVTR